MNLGMKNLQMRKRLHSRIDPYPHPQKFTRYYDYLMYMVGTIAPLALVPQIYQLYVYRNASGLSILTWSLLGTTNLLWATYGVIHRERPIIFANAGMATLDCVIVLGILLFR
jgi:uncharacterized protein with PQ loop repeat